MKGIVTAEEARADARVDPRLGRARFFALFDTNDDSIEFIPNEQNLNASAGAGVQAASNIAHSGAKLVITGNCGPKAFRALKEAGIGIITGAGGDVSGVIRKFKDGKLSYSEKPNVEGHW